jgi:predicted lysophospholipase L1 biosynthesis ABC-type transport system permease subunit
VVRFGAGARTTAGRPLDLLAVDAATLADAAFWHEGFASEPLEEITARLTSVTDGRIPVVVAGAEDLAIDEVEIANVDVPVTVVAEASAFPGMYSLNPTIVVDRETMLELGEFPFDPLNDPRVNTELWVRGDERAARDAFEAMEFPPSTIVTADEIKDLPYISAAINTFVVVNALGLIAGALTLVGTLMYLQARQRSQIVSYALSTRMGLRHGQHRRALALELAAMLGLAFVVGAVLALVAARSTVPYLDPITTIPPDPLLVVPVVAIVLTGVVVAAFSWIGAAITNRRARAVDLGEVMRVAE